MNATSSRRTPDPLAQPPAGDDPLDDPAAADACDDALPDEDDGGDEGQAGALPARELAGADDAQLAAWIDAIVDHDERALAALYDATLARVYGLALRIVHRPALAEEVVEDTFFQVWRQAARFDALRGRALTWLLGMARSRAIDTLRREARYRHDSLDDASAPEPVDESAGRDELLDIARGHADLHRALMQLNAQPRQLVALAFFRGLSHEEIASQTALPLGTVKSQIRRAMLSLRQALGDGAAPALAA